MTEQEIKALFFAQYYGQNVAWCKNSADDYQLFRVLSNTLVDEVDYLILRSVEQLTDEELKVFANQSAYRLDEKNIKKVGIAMVNHLFELNKWSGNGILFLTDYLRSIGVLIPFTYLDSNNKPQTLQPDEIIAKGWTKLQTP